MELALFLAFLIGGSATVGAWYLYTDYMWQKEWSVLDRYEVFNGGWIVMAIVFFFIWPLAMPVIIIFFALEALLGDL